MSGNDETRGDSETNPSVYSSRIIIPHSRRSTIIFSNIEEGGELYENPTNPPHVNAKLRREYETVKELNTAMENVIQSVDGISEMMKEYAKTVHHTERLLKTWKEIMANAEQKQAIIENKVAPPPIFKKPEPVRLKAKSSAVGSGVKRRRIFRSQR